MAKLCDILVTLIVRAMALCVFSERLILAVLRPVRKVFPIRCLWWRIVPAYRTYMRPKGPQLRWVRIPGTIHNLKMDIWGMLGGVYFNCSPYEPKTSCLLIRLLKPGMVFADIGANAGYFSILAASCVGTSGKVLAFEPNPAMRDVFMESVKRNKLTQQVSLFPYALSDGDGANCKLYVPVNPSDSGISSIVPWQGHFDAGMMNKNSTIDVEMRTFDSIAKEISLLRLDVVKLDVEGAELAVLRGMRGVLERLCPQYMIIETSLGSDVDLFLREHGYVAEVIEFLKVQEQWGNILFTRKHAKTLRGKIALAELCVLVSLCLICIETRRHEDTKERGYRNGI